MAMFYQTPELTVRHDYLHRSDLYDANAPRHKHAAEVLSFCLDAVLVHFELPEGAKRIHFEVWDGKAPDRVIVTRSKEPMYFYVDGDLQYIKTAARVVLAGLFKRNDTLHVALTYE